MGSSWRQSCLEHHDRRFSSKIQEIAGTALRTSSRSNHDRSGNSETGNICARLVGEKCDKGDKGENSPSLFSVIYPSEEEWETTTSHRPVGSQLTSGSSHLQDGDSRGDLQKHHGSFMGLLGGHRRRIFPRANALGISQIPRLQAQRKDLRLPVSTFWSIPSSMGIFKSDQAHKTSPSHPSDLYFQLLGRLSHFLNVTRETKESLKDCSGTTSEFGIQNQLGEVEPSSLSVDRISRGDLGSSQTRTLSSTGQNQTHQRSMPGDESEGGFYQERAREPDRTDELCFNVHSTWETPSVTTSDVDESAHSSKLQGRPCSSGRGFQGVASGLEISNISESSSSNESSKNFPRPDDGCVSGRMVWDSTTSESSGPLVRGREAPINELERAEGYSTGSCRISVCVGGEIGTTTVGQHDSSSLPKTPRFGKTCPSPFPDNRNTPFLQELEDLPSTSSSEGCPERSSGPRFSASPHRHRVVSGQTNVPLAKSSSPTISGGPVRDKGKYTTSSVCVPLSRPSGSGLQCLQLEVEPMDIHLPHASNELFRGRCEDSSGVPRKRGSDSPILAIKRMVSSAPSSVQRDADPPSPQPIFVTDDFEGFDGTQQRQILETSRMGSLISSLVGKGANDDSIQVLKHAHKPSTLKQYQGTWRKFISFLEAEHISHDKVDLYVVMNFLASQHLGKGLKYRTIATYKCALAQPLYETFNLRLDDSSLEFFMRGVFNLDPPKPAPMAEWSLNSLLVFLVSNHFEPLHSMSLGVVSQKFLCLLLLATGRRIDEIAHLAQRYDFSLDGKAVTIHWLPEYTPKHFNKDFQPLLPSFEGLDSDSVEDLKLCPIRAFRIYLGKFHSNPRGSINRPLWPQSAKGLTNMFVSTALQAKHFSRDLSVVPIGPHHMRKFAASYSAKMVQYSGEGERKVMERMGCKTMSVLKRHYINNIPNISFKSVIPAGTFVPAIHFGT